MERKNQRQYNKPVVSDDKTVIIHSRLGIGWREIRSVDSNHAFLLRDMGNLKFHISQRDNQEIQCFSVLPAKSLSLKI